MLVSIPTQEPPMTSTNTTQTPDYAGGTTMPEDYFEEHYRPLPSPNGIDTTVDLDTAKAVDEKRVWTIVDAEGNLYVVAGFRFVNRTGDYVITERPWVTGLEEAEWCVFDEDEDGDEEEEQDEHDDDHAADANG
jgi:hypothetical protein